jgi:hypothetical protein
MYLIYIMYNKTNIQSNLCSRPLLNNGHLSTTAGQSPARLILIPILIEKPSTERPPLYNGHFFGVPRVAVVDRFDCIYIMYNINFIV